MNRKCEPIAHLWSEIPVGLTLTTTHAAKSTGAVGSKPGLSSGDNSVINRPHGDELDMDAYMYTETELDNCLADLEDAASWTISPQFRDDSMESGESTYRADPRDAYDHF